MLQERRWQGRLHAEDQRFPSTDTLMGCYSSPPHPQILRTFILGCLGGQLPQRYWEQNLVLLAYFAFTLGDVEKKMIVSCKHPATTQHCLEMIHMEALD